MTTFWVFAISKHYFLWDWSISAVALHNFALSDKKLGVESILRCHFTVIGNLLVEIRRSYDCLIYAIGFPILVRHIDLESRPLDAFNIYQCRYGANELKTKTEMLFVLSKNYYEVFVNRSKQISRTDVYEKMRLTVVDYYGIYKNVQWGRGDIGVTKCTSEPHWQYRKIIFLSSYHPEIFRRYYHWQTWCPC